MMNTRVKMNALGLAAAVASGAIFALPALAADTVRLISRSETWDMVLVESGVAEKYDLDLQLIPAKSGVDAVEALVGGSGDFGSVGAAPMTSLLVQSDTVAIIGTAVSLDGRQVKMIVSADSDAKSIEDMKGKKIATNIGSGSYRTLVDWCAQNGCSLSDFQILNTPPNSIVAALESGSVDAGLWFAPITDIAVAKGIGKILMDFKGANDGQSLWVANRAFAEANPDVVARFLAATIEAQNILVNDPERAAGLIEQGMQKRGRDLTADIILAGLDDFDFDPILDVDRTLAILNAVYDSLAAEGKIRGEKPDFTTGILTEPFAAAQAMAAARATK